VNEERAKRLFRHYFSTVWQAAGLRWDSDNVAEVDDIVDCLIAAAVAEMQGAEPSPQADAARHQ
jgi:hypothetical protein